MKWEANKAQLACSYFGWMFESSLFPPNGKYLIVNEYGCCFCTGICVIPLYCVKTVLAISQGLSQ